MSLSLLDWLFIGGFLLLSGGAGLFFARRGGRSLDDYFISGRKLPWWLAGISMVATAFAIDTPLGITGLVASRGIPGVWYAWAAVMGGAGAFGAFIFAGLLRRSRVITLAELIELRYDGTPAAWLRFWKAIYIGILANAITLGWVIKAVHTVSITVLPQWNVHLVLGGLLAVTLVYTTLSGMWGIAATDFLQYLISTTGSLVLGFYAYRHIGGMSGITEAFIERYGPAETASRLSFFPALGTEFFVTFVVFMTLKWWVDMPGAVTQRVLSSRNDRHASAATFFFATVHFALNYWPMILVALVSLAVYPDLARPEEGYPRLMVELLPTGLLGLLIAAMMAAFMSTVDTHINMGASYLVKDIYQRFIKPEASRQHYVRVSRLATVIMLVLAVIIALNLSSVHNAWYFLTLLFSGYGLVTVARWFWWRVNAWSEIAAMAGSLTFSLVIKFGPVAHLPLFESFGIRFLTVFAGSTIVWITVTLLTPPTHTEHLVRFCRLVHPYPLLWGPLVKRYPHIGWTRDLPAALTRFLMGVVFIYSICFMAGSLLFAQHDTATFLLVSALLSGGIILRSYRQPSAPREKKHEK